MARLRFIAPGHEGQVCVTWGHAFPFGEWVDAGRLAPDAVARLAANPTFEFEPSPARSRIAGTLRLPSLEA